MSGSGGFQQGNQNILYYNEYPKELIVFIMTPEISKHSDSDIIYHGTALSHMLGLFLRNPY
jgi:hypothetical protein